MNLDPRTQELLERYPDELTDDELAELRALAEADPEVEALLDAILMTDAALAGTPESTASLSDAGRQKLADRLEESGIQAWSTGGATPSGNVIEGPKSWSTGGATPSGNVIEGPKSWSTGGATPSGSSEGGPKAWSTGGATPSGSVNEPPPGVVDLSKRRRVSRNPSFMAIAALLLLGAVFVLRNELRPPPVVPDFVFKGDGTEGAIRGDLFVRGDKRVTDGDVRPTDAPITFRVVMTDAASLALLETQGGRTFVVYPPPGEEWRVQPGTHLLQPGGQTAEYRPGAPGEARYTLVGRDGPFDIPPDREVKSPEAFGIAHEGAYGLDELSVRWEGPKP